MSSLEFTLKHVFGRPLYYPRCKASEALAQLCGRKTLARAELQLLLGAGFAVQVFREGSLEPLVEDFIERKNT